MVADRKLIRYLIVKDGARRLDAGLRKLVRQVAAVQRDEDERVKFSQVDVDREQVPISSSTSTATGSASATIATRQLTR